MSQSSNTLKSYPIFTHLILSFLVSDSSAFDSSPTPVVATSVISVIIQSQTSFKLEFFVLFHASLLNGSRDTKLLNCAKNMPVKTMAKILNIFFFIIAYILAFNFTAEGYKRFIFINNLKSESETFYIGHKCTATQPARIDDD